MDHDAEAVFGETVFEDEDDTDNPAFESAKCGICTDAVIDRGVLDCCSHWFCFSCIDNWAAITNLCPLCKNEFQLITCLPVYDTIGTIKVEEHSFRRDDDWCIQGNNNTLSFPSYYIDENAVICLDGDGCKIRSGLTTSEEDLTCDTSIACDSCDIWYHAFCVGFNPDCTSEVSWLCPRCIPNVMQQKSDGASMQSLGNLSSLSSADFRWISDSSFSGKVSVSVADAGETAVVVSMVEGEQIIKSIKNSSEMKLDNNTENHTETSIPDVSRNVKLGLHHDSSECLELIYSSTICNDEKGTIANVTSNNSSGIVLDITSDTAEVQPEVDLKEKSLAVRSLLDHTAHEVTILRQHNNITETSSALSFSEVASLSSPCYLLANGDSKVNSTEDTMSNHCTSDGCMISSLQPFETSAIMNEFPEEESLIDIPLGAPVATFSSSADEEVNDATKTHMGRRSNEHPSKLSSLSAKKIITCASEKMIDVPLQEDFEASDRKFPEIRQSYGIDVDGLNNHIKKRERGLQVKTEADHPAKKSKADRRSQMLTSRKVSVSENSELCSTAPAVSTDLKLKYTPEKQGASIDILSIVRGIDHGSDDSSEGTKFASRDLVKRDTAAGPRVKKIMRIARGKNESSILIQKLRKEIREAVQDKSNDIGKDNAFDAKLLTAFRAAIVEPRNELNPSPVSVRKSLHQKGKVRENLTKKIYGTSTGRRKRAWDRDWEIEFWKHRCKRINPEKVETLQSVLELLKKATSHSLGNSEMDEVPGGQSNNSILSRVYVADASVFPRKDDIKPLSAVERSLIDKFEENKEDTCKNMSKQDSQSAHGNNTGRRQIGLLTASSQVDSTGKRCSTSREASCTKGNLDEPRSKFIKVPSSSGSKDTKHNSEEIASQPGSTVDKRKWALEVLARKNALVNSNMTNENQEDTDGFKEKYPLLAQLPTDMRPTLAPSRHNKIPVSVRQAQLYRITEHYLRRTNLPVIRRTADTELAIADAVNIEKEIFGRSNSKLVYINLCSQSLSQVAKKVQSVEIGSCHFPAVISEGTNQVAEAASSNPEATRCSKVEEALKLAGLFSDSPPNSPYRPAKGADEENETLVNAGEDAIDNVLDIDSHPELDIYGDFEYDLEDLGYIDSSSMAVSEVCPENRDPKLKVVLSNLKCQGPDDFVDSKHETQELRSSEAAVDDHDIFEIEVRTGVPDLAKESQGGVYQEPSLAECEELYGPEKEPLVNMRSTNELIGDPSYMKMVAVSSLSEETENYRSKEGAAMPKFETESFDKNVIAGVGADANQGSHGGEKSPMESSKLQIVTANEVVIVVVPLPAQSHLNQLLHLSLALSKHGLVVHYVGTATHNRQTRDRMHGGQDFESVTRIQFHNFSVPSFPSPPPDPNSSSKFPVHQLPAFETIKHLRMPLASLLRSLSIVSRRVIVIHDPDMSFAASEATLLPNAEAYTFYCSPAFHQLAKYCRSDNESFDARPEVLDVILTSFEGCYPPGWDSLRQLKGCDDIDGGALINSCRPTEGEFVDLLAQQPYLRGKPLFAVGPMNPIVLKNDGGDRHECLEWLDKQPPSSVLYVSFGTTSTMSDEQIQQLANALRDSGQRFIWVARDADRSDIFTDGEANQRSRLPLDYDRQVEGVGVVIRAWAPQLEILAHSSIAVFMSHCGWSSLMESMSMGVPILAWPMHSDQPRNALLVTEYLKVGVLVREWVHREDLVSSAKIEDSITRVMVLDQGKEIMRRAKELGEAIRRAASEGGSSRAELSSFIAHITR